MSQHKLKEMRINDNCTSDPAPTIPSATCAQRLTASMIIAPGLGKALSPGMECSTPYGINDNCTAHPSSSRLSVRGAQRLTASMIIARSHSLHIWCQIASAQRLTASMIIAQGCGAYCLATVVCSTPYGINDNCTLFGCDRCAGGQRCSTPYGINDNCTGQ